MSSITYLQSITGSETKIKQSYSINSVKPIQQIIVLKFNYHQSTNKITVTKNQKINNNQT